MACVYKVVERVLPVYDDATGERLYFDERKNPFDPEKGYKYPGKRQVGEEPERYEVMEGTVTTDSPEGLYVRIPAQPIYEDCEYYHAYTNEELVERYKQKLRDTDYAAIKVAEGAAAREEYEDIFAQRQLWRQKINELEETGK